MMDCNCSGILIVDKEKGWTSHDVCAFVKNRFQISKVGHAGTLDPLATGILILLLGRATSQSAELSMCDKEYRGIFKLGIQTDSHDITGCITGTGNLNGISPELIEETMSRFRGALEQVPPMVSAIKKNGVPLYRLARKGKVVDRAPRNITVHELIIEEINLPYVHFFSWVSKGTYVRTLVHDMGNAMGCFATLTELRRVRSGGFTLEEAVTISFLKTAKPDELRKFVIDPIESLVRA